jgi:hypothetical protein
MSNKADRRFNYVLTFIDVYNKKADAEALYEKTGKAP